MIINKITTAILALAIFLALAEGPLRQAAKPQIEPVPWRKPSVHLPITLEPSFSSPLKERAGVTYIDTKWGVIAQEDIANLFVFKQPDDLPTEGSDTREPREPTTVTVTTSASASTVDSWLRDF